MESASYTLDPEKFERITRWGKLDVVLNGLDAAKKAGLKIKLNTVALKGINDDELASMLNWAGEQNFDMKMDVIDDEIIYQQAQTQPQL